jgi:MFS family permease
MTDRIKGVFREFPREFWILMGSSFIDSLGGAMLFPFLALYLTERFDVGMATVGLVFGMYTVSAVVGSTIGGGLADKLGRKPMLVFGLVASAVAIAVMGLSDRIETFFLGAFLAGVFADTGGPARQAMLADLLPEEKRAQGFSIYRISFNLSHAIGVVIGGYLAARSFFSLFAIDIVLSLFVAVLVIALLPETRPTTLAIEEESIASAFGGYFRVLMDKFFMVFLFATALLVLVFTQFQGTLSVFMRDFHGLATQEIGFLISLNALLVVLFQFPIARGVENKPPFLILALGTAFATLGFGMFSFVAGYPAFLLAIAILTIGEMLFAPVSQAVAAELAPEDMRGRYMAVYGFSWMLPGALGIYLAGLVMDSMDPRVVWVLAAAIGIVAVMAFIALHYLPSRKAAGKERAKETAAWS